MKLLQSLLTVLLASFAHFSFAQHTILGNTNTCVDECITYSVDNGLGGPYYWITTGELQGSNVGEQVEICWNAAGANDLEVVDFAAPSAAQSAEVSVVTEALPLPDIVFPLYPSCVVRDSLTDPTGGNEDELGSACRSVCSGSEVTYFSNVEAGQTAIWEVEGGSIVSQSSEEIIVEWNTTGGGFITLIVISDQGCSAEVSYCIEILDPISVDIVAFSGGPTDINVCLGQEVYLQSVVSQDITQLDWIFDHGPIHAGASTSIAFDEPGTYQVTLLGRTDCGCETSSVYTINVDTNPGPEIMCTGTTCAGTEETYEALPGCSDYTWTISGNGTITDGGGSTDNYVSVEWNSGSVGEVSLSVTGCGTPFCATETTVQIPIISPSASIVGPSVVCKKGFSTYSIQNFNGADYLWNITGNGTIVEGHSTNTIVVEWSDFGFDPDQSQLTVAYDNCYLKCGGSAVLDIELKPEFSISGTNTTCDNGQVYLNFFAGFNAATVDVVVTSPSAVETSYPSISNLNESFTEVGRYKVVATDGAGLYCNQEAVHYFTVIAAPSAPANIQGPTAICLNEYYTYIAPSLASDIDIRWRVTDGSSIQNFSGAQVNIEWKTAGPYTLEVYYYRSDIYCSSESTILDVQRIQNATLTGADVVCRDEVVTYSAGVGAELSGTWAVIPSTAGSISINSDNTVDIAWHQEGNHKIEAKFCGATISYDVEVLTNQLGTAAFDDIVCPGEQSELIIALATAGTIEIVDDQDQVVSLTTPVMLDPGEYLATITSSFGCEQVIPVVIDSTLGPQVRVSSPEGNAYCLPHPLIDIYALDADEGYTFEWFKDGVALGMTDSKISVNDYGAYSVIATDQNGCTFESNEHILWEWCTGDQPPGTCSNSGGGPSLFDYFEVGCNNGNFALKSIGYASTIWEWTFSDPDSGADNFAVGTNPSHTFTNAGFFYVFLDGNAPGEDAVEIITIPAAPRFDYTPGCVGGPIDFSNHSTFIPGYSNIFGYAWDFGDPASGPSNTSTDTNPSHTYSTPGTYTVVLDITGDNGCIASYELEIEVSGGPLADFVVPSSTCSDQGLPFVALKSDDIISYSWEFDDVASGAANTSDVSQTVHEFASTGVYNVTLTVEDIRGCESSVTKSVTVVASGLGGDITADKPMPICVGEELTLSAPAGGAEFFWSTGETSNTITVTEPGLYHVTVSDAGGCSYEPSPISVRVDGLINTHLKGVHYQDDADFNGLRFLDSMEICQGDRMAMIATYVFQGSYDWSIGSSINSYNDTYEFRQLAPGRHDIILQITDPNSGCVIDMEPFTLKINPIPDQPMIAQQGQNLCADTPNLLNVSNPDPALTYHWSTGEIGTAITARSGGYYKVQALNRSGCESPETGIFIADIPDANRINLGCMTACFPDTICIPTIHGASSYQWLRDGVPVPGGDVQDLITQEAGEFQLIVANYYGCADTSDVLSVEAEPSDQSLSGLVFIDDDGNSMWDNGEELLAGIPVHMYDGGSLSATTYTDAAGNYLFDPVTVINPQLVIDTTGLGLDLTGGTFDAMVQYQTCIEDKLQDFPLLRNCTPVSMPLQVFACAGQTTTINSIVLAVGDDWTFVDSGSNGCDSMTMVEVLPFPLPDVEVDEYAACPNTDNGSIDIVIMGGTSLLFAIDVAAGYSSNLSFSGLSAGTHTLFILDGNACPTSQTFEILEAPTPSLTLDPQSSCYGGSNGELAVTSMTGATYQYSLDGVTFGTQSQWSDLSPGAGILYITDAQGCTYQEPYLIGENDEPSMLLTPTNTCAGYSDGAVTIESSSTGNYEYSMDGVSFSSSSTFNGLSEGAHTIYIREDGHCVTTMALVIDSNPNPIVTATVDQPCVGESNGGVALDGNGATLLYSNDGIDFGSDPNFGDLGAGVYTFYLQGDDLCVYPIEVEIEEAVEMDVVFDEPITDCNTDIVALIPEVVDPVGEVRFMWSDGSDSETFTAIEDGDITVTVEDDCTSYTHTYAVDIQEVIEEQPIYFPNIFSPNNDGANECFVPSLNPQTQIISYELMVFDRWGNKLFETTDFTECWDGNFKDQNVRTGVFVYVMNLEYTYCTEVERLEIAGDVTIVH